MFPVRDRGFYGVVADSYSHGYPIPTCQQEPDWLKEYMDIALDRDIAKGDAILDELMDDSVDEGFDNMEEDNG